MRTALVLLSVIGAVFAAGLVCGLLLSVSSVGSRPIRFPAVGGVDVGRLARRLRPDADREAPDLPATSDADREWDTYDSGAANAEPA